MTDPIPQQREDEFLDKRVTRPRGKQTAGKPSGLTCNEASLDDLLSEGEST
jgi:hypothetical protein